MKDNELLTILKRELDVHTELVKNARLMNRAIRERNVDDVSAFISVYDKQLQCIDDLEDHRIAYCTNKAEFSGTDIQKLDVLLVYFEPEQREVVHKIRTELKKKIEELVMLNTSNKILLSEALNEFAALFSSIHKSIENKSGYHNKKRRTTHEANPALLDRVI
jgi:hypothetical protein